MGRTFSRTYLSSFMLKFTWDEIDEWIWGHFILQPLNMALKSFPPMVAMYLYGHDMVGFLSGQYFPSLVLSIAPAAFERFSC